MRVIVMGVSGAGKTTIGRMLSERLGCEFVDADDLHPTENKDKMSRGVALTDEDRGPWLDRLRSMLASKPDVVLACSALKAAYRKRLDVGDTRFVFLRIERAQISKRLRERPSHFFDPTLIDSQFDALEVPSAAIDVDASQSPDEIVEIALAALSGGR